MSRVISPKIPNIKGKSHERERRKIYSIHKQTNPYTIVLNEDNPDMRSTLVAFRKPEDALTFACLLECHHKLTYEWPYQTSDFMPTLGMLGDHLNLIDEPIELTVCEWETYIIKSYCHHHMLDLLLLTNIDWAKSECVIKCSLFKPEISNDDYINSLNSMFEL